MIQQACAGRQQIVVMQALQDALMIRNGLAQGFLIPGRSAGDYPPEHLHMGVDGSERGAQELVVRVAEEEGMKFRVYFGIQMFFPCEGRRWALPALLQVFT